jgi:hypothetical protein
MHVHSQRVRNAKERRAIIDLVVALAAALE